MNKRKSYAIILFVLLSIPICSLVCMQIFQLVIKQEMKEKLEYQLLHKVTINKADLVWVKKNSEILLEGRMFDVKSMSQEKDILHIQGLFDDEETAIENFIQKNNSGNSTNQQRTIVQFFQVFQSAIHTDFINGMLVFFVTNKIFYTENRPALSDQILKVNTPPPKI